MMSKHMKTPSLMMITLAVALCLETKNWWALWFTLEMGSIAFLLMMVKESMNEKIFNFFIFQALASTLLMMSIFFSSWESEKNEYQYMKIMLTISMFLKIGMFPFQGWVVSFVKNFSWLLMMILLTWQKLIPMMILVKNNSIVTMKTTLMMVMLIISMMMMKVSQSKTMMLLSSLIHNSWMFMSMMAMKALTIFYLSVYSIMSIIMMKMFKANLSKFFTSQKTKKGQNVEMISSMMAMAGIPPSIGFLVKMSIISLVVWSYSYKMWLILMFVGSCMSFYVYFMVFMSGLMMTKKKEVKSFTMEKISKMKSPMVLNIMPMMIMLM